MLVYVHDSFATCERTSEKSYWKTLKKMPWLALPFQDPVCKKLQRVFDYPLYTCEDEDGPDHSLVIIGPQGKFVELYGADILKNYGIAAYPFTQKRVAKLEAERIKELKLDMFWSRKTTLIQKNGSTVSSFDIIILVSRPTLLLRMELFFFTLLIDSCVVLYRFSYRNSRERES